MSAPERNGKFQTWPDSAKIFDRRKTLYQRVIEFLENDSGTEHATENAPANRKSNWSDLE